MPLVKSINNPPLDKLLIFISEESQVISKKPTGVSIGLDEVLKARFTEGRRLSKRFQSGSRELRQRCHACKSLYEWALITRNKGSSSKNLQARRIVKKLAKKLLHHCHFLNEWQLVAPPLAMTQARQVC
jgi:hypothetical protein